SRNRPFSSASCLLTGLPTMTGQVVMSSSLPSTRRLSRCPESAAGFSAPIMPPQLEPSLTGSSAADALAAGEVLQQLVDAWSSLLILGECLSCVRMMIGSAASLLGDAAEPAQAEAVTDDEDAGERHRRACEHGVEHAQRCDRDGRDVVGKRPEQVRLDRAQGPAGEPDRVER